MAYPFANLSTLGNPLTHNTLKELQSPWFATATLLSAPTFYLLLYKFFSLFLFVLMVATWRKRKIRDWLLAVVFFGLSVSAFRNIPLFMLACLPLAAASWMDLEWAWLRKTQDSVLWKPLTAWAFAILLLALGLRVLTGAYYVSDRRTDRFGLGLDPLAQPVKACRFLVENHLDGKILNQLDDGGWLDWQGPQKTFIDPRFEVLGEEFYSKYLSAEKAGGLKTLADEYGADILFFSPLNTSWVAQLNSIPNWRLVYLDPCAVVYLRKGYRDNVPTLDSTQVLSQASLSKSILADIPALLQAPPPSAWSCFWSDLYKPVNFPDDLSNLGIFCGTTGHGEEFQAFFLEAIRRTQGRYYDFYYNLGLFYAYAGRKTEAGLCVRRVLKEKPDDPIIRRIQGALAL